MGRSPMSANALDLPRSPKEKSPEGLFSEELYQSV